MLYDSSLREIDRQSIHYSPLEVSYSTVCLPNYDLMLNLRILK